MAKRSLRPTAPDGHAAILIDCAPTSDAEQLKRKVAENPELVKFLASFAFELGFDFSEARNGNKAVKGKTVRTPWVVSRNTDGSYQINFLFSSDQDGVWR